MRNSGVYCFHVWRVFPIRNADDSLKFTASIDGQDMGDLMSTNLEDAIFEIKQLVEEMMKEGQR